MSTIQFSSYYPSAQVKQSQAHFSGKTKDAMYLSDDKLKDSIKSSLDIIYLALYKKEGSSLTFKGEVDVVKGLTNLVAEEREIVFKKNDGTYIKNSTEKVRPELDHYILEIKKKDSEFILQTLHINRDRTTGNFGLMNSDAHKFLIYDGNRMEVESMDQSLKAIVEHLDTDKVTIE